jgi:hypothetical protein
MLLAKNVVGNQQDWAQYITIADGHKTPVLNRLPVGDKPVNVLKQYQADSYTEPTPVAWIDGKDWDVFESAAKNRGELKARAQEVVKTASVSRKAQDITDAAGVADELAREIKKKLVETSRTIEATICCDQEAAEDDGTTGDQTRGMGKWIQNGAQALYPVPVAFRTPTASVYSDTKANLNEDAVMAILESVWLQTGQSDETRMLMCGSQLKKRFKDFQLYIPSALNTQSTARVTTRTEGDNRLGSSIDFYDSEFGELELHLTRWNAHPNFSGGSATKSKWRGYIINPQMWALAWNQKPTVHQLEFRGGSYNAAINTIWMLLCRNPVCEGKIDPSDA